MEYLPLSKVNSVVYCERRFYLEVALGEAWENHYLIEGRYLHEDLYAERDEVTGLLVWSDRLGLIGVVDRLEWRAGWPVPIEYKRGFAGEEAFPSDAVQLAAQALCLWESRGLRARVGFVHYHKGHARRQVEFTPEAFREVERAVARMRALLALERPPGVSVPPSKCQGCSLKRACQPELYRKGVVRWG